MLPNTALCSYLLCMARVKPQLHSKFRKKKLKKEGNVRQPVSFLNMKLHSSLFTMTVKLCAPFWTFCGFDPQKILIIMRIMWFSLYIMLLDFIPLPMKGGCLCNKSSLTYVYYYWHYYSLTTGAVRWWQDKMHPTMHDLLWRLPMVKVEANFMQATKPLQ